MIRKWLMMSLAVATYLSAFASPEIQLVADGATGEYCGVGYGITVNVSTPASGYTVKYAESADGPWVDELKYVNVCTDKPIYYQVTAEGYTTATGSANVTVTPKELTEDIIWLVFPSEDYVYDGTAKEPDVAAADGDPSIITDNDWEVSFTDNVDAGTATATFTGKGNYTGTCTEAFEIAKADNSWTTEPAVADWTYGQTASTPVSAAQVGTATVTWSSGSVPTLPGSYTATFTVAESANYNELTKTVNFKVLPATINLVADGASGEYCGVGYGITVNVSTPASGYTVKYAESADGPWVDELKYVNVCADKPIYYQVTAEGYTTATGSANVTVTPKELTEDIIWLVFPSEDYVYDGTAKEPDVAAADGDPSIITDGDWEVSFTDNVNAGTATATFTGKGNYTGTCTEAFEIAKADNSWTTAPAVADWTYGQTASTPVSAAQIGSATVTWSSGSVPTLPGSYTATFTVPESDNYNELTKTVNFKVLPATINLVADGASGEYCGVGYGITVNVSTPSSGYTIKYAESADGPWVDELKYVNVCTDKPIYYQVTAEGYTTATGSANVTVTPKELTEDIIWLVLPTEDYVYDGTAKEPDVAAADGDPSIITDGDWEVSFADNVDAGTATATFTGKGNYTGTCTEEFEIAKADNSWTTEPAVADWTYGQAASTPVSAAQVGSATVTWSSGSVPTLPGSYTATFTVAESDNYNELTKTVNFKVLPATINLVVDGTSGEYCGVGYGITVNVSKPASGYTVKYAESAEGPWVDELKYVNVCADKPIYYQVTAEGYTTATGSANVTITPKELTEDIIWLVFPSEDYVYDGTAKEPEVAAFDGEPSIITDDDWEVSFTDNVNAGTATATFTGKGNYTGTYTEEFEILKADNEWTTEPAVADWTYGQTESTPVSAAQVGTATVTWSSGSVPTLPGSYTATFTVAESENYNELTKTVNFKVLPATINLVVDGASGEYCGVGYGITVNVSTPASGYTVKYAESADGPWVDEMKYVNVCTDKPIYYQVTAEGYTTATGSANVTVTPKTLTNDYVWLVLPVDDYVYDGTAKEPEVAFGDGDPSILTEDDFDVAYTENVDAGTATATFTGKGNYTGTCTEEFEILKADNEWTTEPAVADWTYGQPASTPVSAAQVGTATVTWSSGSVPTLPGSYTATFTVAESENYNELTKTVNFKVLPATINLVVDGTSGEYCGVGYGITVNVSKPASGYTVKYAESAEGPWVDELKYVNVCADKPIYYQVTAEGYTTATGSANVTVTPKELTNDSIWLVLPAEDYVYDGTAKEPDVAAADGDPSIITDNDWEVSFADNVNAGTATATFTGKGNYTGTCTEEFVILKADITGGGEEPGAGSVPAGGKSKFDATTEYDGQPHTIQTNELMTAFVDQCTGAGVAAPDAFQYSTDWNGSEGTWTEDVPTFVDVVTTSVWYKVCMADANYDDYVHEAQLTITPRNISNVTVDPIADQTETGAAIEPTLTVTDGEPSIVTANDYTAAYADNVAPGTATATLTGKGNYTGTKSVNFTILPSGPDKALLDASVAWTLLKATGTYFAQVTVTCTNGFDKGVSDLKFLFADRMDGSTVVASLWSTPQRAANPNTEVHDGVTYRVVTLPTAALTAENAPAVYGVSNLAATTIPVDERLIEMFVRKRVDPATGNESAAGVEDFVGYVAWTSNGETTMIPVVAGSAAKTLKKVSLMAAAPMSLGTINASLAVGVAVDETAKPYCRIVSFAANDEKISGFVEVGATLGDVQKAGTLGDNARMSLYGATSLTGPFEKIGSARGAFSFPNTKGFRFFKAGLEIDEIVK